MASSDSVHGTVQRLVETVGAWEGVTVDDHRFGGTEFRVGSREFGHVHEWGMLDIPYYRPLRDALVDAGETDVHHLLTESGWTTYRIQSPDEYEHALWLLRLSYLYNVAVVKKQPDGAATYAAVDVDSEVASMALSEPVLAAFERRTPA